MWESRTCRRWLFFVFLASCRQTLRFSPLLVFLLKCWLHVVVGQKNLFILCASQDGFLYGSQDVLIPEHNQTLLPLSHRLDTASLQQAAHSVWVCVVLQEAEKREARMPWLHGESSQAVLCVKGCFLRSQETLLLETDFPWQMIWAKARLKALSAAPACAGKNEEGMDGGGQLWNSSPSYYRVWGCFLRCFFLFFNDRIFSLPVTPLNQTAVLHSSGFTAECYLVLQMSTHGGLPGRRSYPSLGSIVGVHAEPQSDGRAGAQT